ncbi:MAG: ATP-dependent Clp protease ATP-binding subunit [Candidatus Dojkabacteria bacterium]
MNKFSKNAIQAVHFANRTCVKLKSPEMTLEHLFIGILSVQEGVGSKVLSKLGLDPEGTIKSIEEELLNGKTFLADTVNEPQGTDVTEVVLSNDIRNVFEKAFDIAINSGHNYVGTEHLLLGLLEVRNNPFVKELSKLGIDFDKIKKELEGFVQYPEFQQLDQLPGSQQTGNQLPPARPGPQKPDLQSRAPGALQSQQGSNSIFESLGRNLTEEAKLGKLDPVIGRESEIERVMQVLSRRSKNNPILLGDAGVGKTAIVEGLAQKIADGMVSPILANYEIWSIDIAAIVAGSQLRGDVEQKILDMINEIETRGNVILFIDEIHTMLGAGATSNNSLDIGNILKPALARGILHCIGATTIDEYRKHFDEDPALQRRFQPIDVDELSEDSTYQVLRQLKPVYEMFHNVKITDNAIKTAIKLSNRFITERYLPDKAIDVIDEACARNKLERVQITPEFKEELDELRRVITKKNAALQDKRIEEASVFLDEEKQIMKNLSKLEKKMKKSWNSAAKTISEKHIKSVIHNWTKIPISSLEENSLQLVKKLEKDLRTNVIGQDYACSLVANSIKRTKAGLSGFDRPLASYLFVGPTGVGKTELAKQLAKSLFGKKENLIQVDMSELMESHSVSKLIGAPPGYVGFDQGGQLSDRVRRNPFSVILFDEIEKASPEVLNILLQIMDEGRLTDGKGRGVNFKNTIIIMTSNVGAELLRKDSNVGIYLGTVEADDSNPVDQKVVEAEERIIEELKEYLQPEFINRIDDIIVFRELNRENIFEIAKLHVSKFVKRLKAESNVVLKNALEEKIVNYIVDTGYSEDYGAREINRVIRSTLENAVADKILELNWDPDSRRLLHLDIDLDTECNFILKEAEKAVQPA